MENFEEEEREEELREKTSFFWEWFAFCTVIIGLSLVIILVATWYTGWLWLAGFMILPLVICGREIFQSRLIVDQTHAVIYQWNGHKIKPFVSGVYFPFPYFGLLSAPRVVPTNDTPLYVFIGSRKGEEWEKQYGYGSETDIQPGTGAALKLTFKVVVKVKDFDKFAYRTDDPLKLATMFFEKEVVAWVHRHDGEYVYDNFSNTGLKDVVKKKKPQEKNEVGQADDFEVEVVVVADDAPIFDRLSEKLNDLGLELVCFIPGNTIDTLEVEKHRSEIEDERYRGELLDKELNNQEKLRDISEMKNKILTDKIKAIMAATNCSGVEALEYVKYMATTEMIPEATKNGGAYVKDSGGNTPSIATLDFLLKGSQKMEDSQNGK